MKKHGIILSAIFAASLLMPINAKEKLVILQTNDTHSQIDPNDKGLGGIQRRKVLIDSIRAAQPHTLLVDAGDAVQGTLFFTLYNGEVEIKMMNELGYDLAILGNHDFDNGVEKLADNLAISNTCWLTTNYDLTESPLQQYFSPYKIFDIAGKRIAFIGINLDPKGMIAEGNYNGVRYLDAVKAANATAWSLKHNEKADMVVAITHIGYTEMPYPSDRDLAAASEDIDIILGGHSHTTIRPGSGMEWAKNKNRHQVLITQNGKSGQFVAEVIIDLDSIRTKKPEYRQHIIDQRLDRTRSARIDSIIAPYRKGVDDMMNLQIGRTAKELNNDGPALLNFVSDFIHHRGSQLTEQPVDLAITNKGSLRRSLPAGKITQGEIISMQPFANRIFVIEIKGSDLADAMDVMAKRDGDGVSANVDITYDPDTDRCIYITINGKPIDKTRTYTVATIDYLANGGDYMEPLTKGKVIAKSDSIVYNDLISYIKTEFKGKKINPSDRMRMRPEK